MFLYLVNAAVRCLLHIAVIIFSCSFSSFVIRVGRCARLRRSVRMSASVGADVCVGRCVCLRRSMRMSASVGADDVCILKKVA